MSLPLVPLLLVTYPLFRCIGLASLPLSPFCSSLLCLVFSNIPMFSYTSYYLAMDLPLISFWQITTNMSLIFVNFLLIKWTSRNSIWMPFNSSFTDPTSIFRPMNLLLISFSICFTLVSIFVLTIPWILLFSDTTFNAYLNQKWCFCKLLCRL